jgi:hypothetical protein
MFHEQFREEGAFNSLTVTVDGVADGDGNSLPTNVKLAFDARSHLTVVGAGDEFFSHDAVSFVELRVTGEEERQVLAKSFRRIADILAKRPQ